MELGGQALIEGVLIKSKEKIAISVRKKGKIETKTDPTPNFSKKFSKIPFIRGIIVLIETLYLGIKYLNYSAEQQLENDEKISKLETIFSISISLIIAIGLFIIIPLLLSKFLTKDRVLFSVIDGIIRIIIFLLFLIIISLSKDIRRTFEYHGAEHKSIACYEANEELTVKNVKKYSTLHPRCGTSFIIYLLFISIIVFSIVWSEHFYIRLLQRIILIPIIASISYEILKLAAKKKDFFINKIIITPGLLIQKITTKEPDEKQIEVAISAVKAVTK